MRAGWQLQVSTVSQWYELQMRESPRSDLEDWTGPDRLGRL